MKLIRPVGLPADLFDESSPKLIKIYHQQAATESTYDIRKHPLAIRYTLMANHKFFEAALRRTNLLFPPS